MPITNLVYFFVSKLAHSIVEAAQPGDEVRRVLAERRLVLVLLTLSAILQVKQAALGHLSVRFPLLLRYSGRHVETLLQFRSNVLLRLHDRRWKARLSHEVVDLLVRSARVLAMVTTFGRLLAAPALLDPLAPGRLWLGGLQVLRSVVEIVIIAW